MSLNISNVFETFTNLDNLEFQRIVQLRFFSVFYFYTMSDRLQLVEDYSTSCEGGSDLPDNYLQFDAWNFIKICC